MVINTNISALRTTRTLAESMNRVSKQIKQLSSGSKIVSPEDDAAGLSVSSKLGAQVRTLNAAAQNTQNYIQICIPLYFLQHHLSDNKKKSGR